MKRIRLGDAGGFTIIELMTTLAVLSMVTLSIFSFLIQLDGTIDKTESRLIATTAAYEKYQEYETKSFTNITQGVVADDYERENFTASLPSELLPPREAKVYVRNITASLKKLDVRVTYQESPSQSRTINFSTLIQESGVGR